MKQLPFLRLARIFAAFFFTFSATAANGDFKITRIEYDRNGGQLLLIWESSNNRSYSIETSVDLRRWNSASDKIGSGGVLTGHKILTASSNSQSFFRIVDHGGALATDPILTLGHGAFIGADGKEFVPTASSIQNAQQYYISNLIARVEGSGEKQKLIQILVTNGILANALFLDWLLERAKPDNLARVTSVRNALRWHYVLKIQTNSILPNEDKVWSKGIPPEAAKQLETNGVSVFYLTNAGGDAYREECRECGVPIPPPMFGKGWRFLGSFDEEFLVDNLQAELWIHEAPEGVCLALPRYLVGVIL